MDRRNIKAGAEALARMEIGINMDERDYEFSDYFLLVNEYGFDIELGYLKINPERIPVVEGKYRAEAEFEKFGSKLIEFPICGGRYILISDRRNIEIVDGSLILTGTAYIAKRQYRTDTALTGSEVGEWLCRFMEGEGSQGEMIEDREKTMYDFPVMVFDYDENTDSWN